MISPVARYPVLVVALALAFSVVAAAAPAAGPGLRPPAGSAWSNLPPHPRLFATAAHWQDLRQRLAGQPDPVTARLFALLRARADSILQEPPVVIRQRNRGKLSGTMLEPAREIQRRVLALAAMAQLTGETRYRDRALVELRILSTLSDWNPAVFLDTAEATLAAAVGFDWLHDRLRPPTATPLRRP